MQHSIARRIAAAIASFIPLFATAASLPAYRNFGDWTVVCDNAGDCEARGFGDSGEDRITFRFVRAAGGASTPTLTLYGLAPKAGPTLHFDGATWRLPGDTTTRRRSEDRDGAAQTELTITGLEALRGFAGNAHRATQVASGDRRGSLAGFDAAMLFVDDVQGRIATPTAIAHPGTSQARVPGPRPLPVVHAVALPQGALDAASARRYVAALPTDALECEDLREDDAPAVLRIGRDEVVALRPCYRGAYQTGYALFRGPRNDPRRARLLELPYPPGATGETGILIEPALDAATGRLSMFAKGRGLADCGESGEWAFDGRGFVPVAYARLERCGWPEPGDYPVLWRAKVTAERAR
jgi:hypothetical protein